MNIDELTIGDAKAIAGMVCGAQPRSAPKLEVGKAYFFFTIPLYRLGRVTEVCGDWVRLEQSGWVANAGRIHEAFATGSLSEFEPIGDEWVNVSAATSVVPWNFDIPTEAK